MNLPSLTDFVRDPGAAWCAQHAEYAAMARECLSAARGSYGTARKVHLRSARHYGKLARMTLQAASQNLPQGNGNAAGCFFPGHNSHRGGNCIKAPLQFSARKGPEGIAAGLSPWLDKCLSRTCVKAAYSFFLSFIQRSARLTANVITNLMTAKSKASATDVVGVSVMTNTRGMSNLSVGGAR